MAKGSSKKPPRGATARARSALEQRLMAFVTEQFPFAAPAVARSLGDLLDSAPEADPAAIDALRSSVRGALTANLRPQVPDGIGPTTPGASAGQRLDGAMDELVDAVDGCLRRESIADQQPGFLRRSGPSGAGTNEGGDPMDRLRRELHGLRSARLRADRRRDRRRS